MKKEYISPELNVIKFEEEDLLTGSTIKNDFGSNPGDQEEDYNDFFSKP